MSPGTLLAFDADDTLWVNEPYFLEVEEWFLDAVRPFAPRDEASRRLHEVIVRNLDDYGFGVKSFVLSLLETATELGGADLPANTVADILTQGRAMLHRPMELLDGVAETLAALAPRFPMLLVTKGDQLDQERKIARSKLAPFFDHCEVLVDKTPDQYERLFARHGVAIEDVVMVGNSIKSDIVPILELGGRAVYIPFGTVWGHEVVPLPEDHPRLVCLTSIRELVGVIEQTSSAGKAGVKK